MMNPFTTRRRSREGALAWLARLKRGLRPDEGPQLIAWLRRRSRRRLIAKAAVEWHGPEVLAVLSEIFPIDPASLEPRRGRHPATAVAIFAGIVMFPVVLVLVLHMLGLGGPGESYTATPYAPRRLSLQDGTRVALNRGTGISVMFWEHTRIVQIARGEATFRVASERHRPFHVHAAGRDFETMSATFDVRLTAPDRLTVTVLKGTLTVFPPPMWRRPDGTYEYKLDPQFYKPILLEPFQMLAMEPDDQSGRTLSEEDLRVRLSWLAGT